MAWRWVNRAASLILALVVLATLGGGYLFYRAMPATSGVETLPGLSAEVRVWRDHFGVPHIFAASMDDAARALGYTHASERMFQMEILRRVGQGRMAEIRGAELLGVDKFIRTVGFYREAETSFSALSPWAQKRLEAYADGVNAFLASHAAPARIPPRRRSIPNPGGRPIAWSLRSSRPISCRRASSSSSSAPGSSRSSDRTRRTGCFRPQSPASRSRRFPRSGTDTRPAKASTTRSAP